VKLPKSCCLCTSKGPFSDQSAVVVLQDSANLFLFVPYHGSTKKPQMGRLIDFSYQMLVICVNLCIICINKFMLVLLLSFNDFWILAK
jgi:hypothetical protein